MGLEVDLSLQKNYRFISSQSINKLGERLSKEIKLEQLSLNLQESIKDKGILTQIVQCIPKSYCLQSLMLNLESSTLEDQDLLSLGLSFVNLKNLNHLELNLKGCKISDIAIEGFSNKFAFLENLNYFKLDISQNCFSDKGFISLGQNLLHFKYLSEFELIIFQITNLNRFDDFIEKLSQIETLQKLTLDLAFCIFFAVEFGKTFNLCKFKELTLVLKGYNLGLCQNLRILNLEFINLAIDDEKAIDFIKSLSQSKSLRQLNLNLSRNKISLKGSLAMSIEIYKIVNLNILSMNFSYNDINQKFQKYIIKNIKCTPKIVKYSLNF